MSATELAALIVAIASLVAVAVLAFALVSIAKTLEEVRTAVELLRTQTIPVVDELGDNANAKAELGDTVAKVDPLTRLAHLTRSDPLIKALALASGTGQAAKSFRRKRER